MNNGVSSDPTSIYNDHFSGPRDTSQAVKTDLENASVSCILRKYTAPRSGAFMVDPVWISSRCLVTMAPISHRPGAL